MVIGRSRKFREERSREQNNKETGKSIGTRFEAKTASLLASSGYRVVCRNFRSRVGEIDLIATNEHCLLFVEVKARSSSSHGGAVASVTRKKQCKIARCAALYLQQQPHLKHLPCRFDVVIWMRDGATDSYCARWIPGAFVA
ncbi:MAG: YraN family protein [Pseudomonadota bacterium]